jgi:hypothetical protein
MQDLQSRRVVFLDERKARARNFTLDTQGTQNRTRQRRLACAQLALECDCVARTQLRRDSPGEVFRFGKAAHQKTAFESRRFVRHSPDL